jgi:23S rRNA (uridine2552-2'-O)-methyltransferase
VARRGSSSRWLDRQAKDVYVRRSKQDNYRARSAYKLKDLNSKYKIIRRGSKVVELGAAPGGWSQVVSEVIGKQGCLIALDVLECDPLNSVQFIRGDCSSHAVREQLLEKLGGARVDVVLSDMAPNISGIALKDEAASIHLAEVAADFCGDYLKRDGTLVLKLFDYPDTIEFIKNLKTLFSEVIRTKPTASRAESREFYVVARGFVI